MERGGPSWSGWRFGPYGRCKEWRLHAPDGAVYCAEEIAEIRRMELDLDYLQVRVKLLESLLSKTSIYLSADEMNVLQNAARILLEIHKSSLSPPSPHGGAIPFSRPWLSGTAKPVRQLPKPSLQSVPRSSRAR